MDQQHLLESSKAVHRVEKVALALIRQVPTGPAYHDFETGKTTVSIFLKDRAEFSRRKAELVQGLNRIRDCGLTLSALRLTCRKIRQEDWAESWKHHFKPIQIGRRLLIRPTWSRRRARKGEALVELDPGLSFGTGQHPTTLFCLRQLVARRLRGKAQSFLDLGTGSGILAIAAAKLGYAPIDAVDIDAEAIRIARTNACANRVRKHWRLPC